MKHANYFLCFLFIVLGIVQMAAQKEDYHWCLGYNGEQTTYIPPIGGIDMVFHNDSIHLEYIKRPVDFDDCNASVCDTNGKLILYTNGVYVADQKNRKLKNGTGLDNVNQGGNQSRQGAIIFPHPNKNDSFILMHNYFDIGRVDGILTAAIFKIFTSYIALGNTEERGEVYLKKQVLISDTLNPGFSAVRHANGRDWFIPLFRGQTDYGYLALVDPKGISVKKTFDLNLNWTSASTQSQFSQDGSLYVSSSAKNIFEGYFLDIWNFDRCSGSLSKHIGIHYKDTIYSTGLAISPSGQYAYVSAFDELHQYDLWANDIEASRIVVAEEDGFETIPGFNRLYFRSMKTGPDGKIYITGPGTTQHLHVIHAPDSAGTDCRVELHGIELPAYTFGTIPNIPNFRLGPIDGSPCDTLGIDNVPLARFRHDGQRLEKHFIDLSAFEPENYYWEFGDGFDSNERQPSHRYDSLGIYNVCLTVSNSNGSDRTCRDVWVDTVFTTKSTGTLSEQIIFYPSPSPGHVTIKIPNDLYPCTLSIQDSKGNVIQQIEEISDSDAAFQFQHFPPGVYQLILRHEGEIIWTDRWVKI